MRHSQFAWVALRFRVQAQGSPKQAGAAGNDNADGVSVVVNLTGCIMPLLCAGAAVEDESADDVNPMELASPTTSEECGSNWGSHGEGASRSVPLQSTPIPFAFISF